MTPTDATREQIADRLYEAYAKPLEAEHLGEYVAISVDGRIHVGSNLAEVATKAPEVLGPGVFLFRIGERTVGRLR